MNARAVVRVSSSILVASLLIASSASMSAFGGTDPQLQPGAAQGAGPTHVVSPSQHQLTAAAILTAAFNVNVDKRTGANYPSGLPFQMLYTPPQATDFNNTGGLYTTFYVAPGTKLYVPVVQNDNSLPIIGDFPPAGDRKALQHYMFSQDQLGLVYARIAVDGHVVTLGPNYAVEVAFDSPLPDGGTLYQVVAALMSPLPKGVHTVEISAKVTGDALSEPPFDQIVPCGQFKFSTTYTVVVQ